ncbi:MAG: site-specific integrase [Solirubrobacterales bacterium]|nr:site-specific integrase [Solirubrobacterales bacterium]
MASGRSRAVAGIEIRHQRRCRAFAGDGACNCSPGYRASAWSPADGRPVRRTFRTLDAARAWLDESRTQIRHGVLRASQPRSVAEAAEAWLAGARAGRIRNRSGDTYKPSVLRSYERTLQKRVLPRLGTKRFDRLAVVDVQDFVEDMLGEDLHASTIRNVLMPLRAMYRRAVARGEIVINPTRGLELPAVRGRRDRIASPAEARRLLLALEHDHAIWTTAMYAGLRRGELQALHVQDVDLEHGVLRVRHSWDRVDGLQAPKTRAGTRTVPLTRHLRAVLAPHLLALPWSSGLLLGRTPDRPFEPRTLHERARRAWAAAGLTPITLHECRHSYASLMIAAGVNAKALSTYMGHASVVITFDLYGHLLPGNERESAGLLEALLDAAEPTT